LKILFIHNNYASDNTGEEHAAGALADMLSVNGHKVEWYRRSSAELINSPIKRAAAFFTAILNPGAVLHVKEKIREFKPDIVQVQNLYPVISPRVLKVIKSAGLPIVMRCPNYRLFCPTGLFFDSGNAICEKCTGPGKEWWCIKKNCTGSPVKSVGYALRNFVARITGVFNKYVDIFIVQSQFQKHKFIELGIPEHKIGILPGITPEIKTDTSLHVGKYITFVGRVSPEKGIDDSIEAAKRLPDLKFAIAGEVPDGVEYDSPSNVEWKGFLKGEVLDDLYRQSQVIVVPSRWYEGFPNVVTRAMAHAIPVITTNIGVFPEIVTNSCGLTYSPGDIEELVTCIQKICKDIELAGIMGEAGKHRALNDFSKGVIYDLLIRIYGQAKMHADGRSAL